MARYGEARAKSMALEARRTALEEMSGAWGEGRTARLRKPPAWRKSAPDARVAPDGRSIEWRALRLKLLLKELLAETI